MLTGGFPCQDISVAGKGKGIREGERSGLWREYAKAIRSLRPRYALIENVSAITQRGLDIVLADLAEAGYDAEWFTLSASDVGAWHRRERIFIFAYSTSKRRLQCEHEEQP
jgi:DNA (cytosine-5)-methyltransferase 1